VKKTGILNRDISDVVASMGHLDTLIVCDAGLPIPPTTRRIDLAVKAGLPSFLDTVASVASELKVDSIILAKETIKESPQIIDGLKKIFPGIEIRYVSHEELKEKSRSARAIIRTGEFTPYANVILVSGVVF
jgi:D-ribose pyranase